MSKPIEVSEIFMSLEGEGPHTTRPTAYVRFARCNFTCSKFNNPTNERDNKGYAPLTFNPKDYSTLSSLPVISRGCDSQYAVNPAFAHIWEHLTIDQIAEQVKAMLPRGEWVHPVTGLPVILSLTGGEPTLHWKRFREILDHPTISQCKHVLVETNCSVPLNDALIADVNQWLKDDPTRKWTWSNSPKLSASGEPWDKAIRPEIAVRQLLVADGVKPEQVEQYFKFVCNDSQADFDEVAQAMAAYHGAGVPNQPNIWIMPAACTDAQQNEIAQQVAKMCMDHGYLFCYRFQNALWGNAVGT